MSVKFSYSSTEVELQNPVRGNKRKIKKYQTLGRTAGGTIFTYTKGQTTYQFDLEFENLRDSEKSALESFFSSTVAGITTQFTYTDHLGIARTARFISDELEWEEIDSEGSSPLSFPSGSGTYPSNRFLRGVWKVRFALEVSS